MKDAVPCSKIRKELIKRLGFARLDIIQSLSNRLHRLLPLSPKSECLLGRHLGRRIGTKLLTDKTVEALES